jgi:hypothetical protein
MIRYTLRCDKAHDFESWFQSAEAFDALKSAGHVTCPDCGSTDVEKSLMAPGVRTARKSEVTGPLRQAETEREKALASLRNEVEKNSEYVGLEFATEARRMHDGEAPERSIYGEARIDEARKLLEDGVPVAPLPFTPRSRTN